MKKNYFLILIIFCCISMCSFTPANDHNGTLYIKIKSDPNPGNIHLRVKSLSGETILNVQLAPNETIEKTFTGLKNGPQSWYSVSFDWPSKDFHNISASGGCVIAWGVPVTANNMILSWQIAGEGTFGSIPVLLP